MAVLRVPGERRIGRGLQRTQALVEGDGIAVAFGGGAQGVINLVGVAGADEFVNGGDIARVGGAVGVKLQVEQSGGGAVVLRAQPGVDGVAVQVVEAGIPVENERRRGCSEFHQGNAEFVRNAHGGVQAVRPAAREQDVELVDVGSGERVAADVVAVEAGAPGAGVIKEEVGHGCV